MISKEQSGREEPVKLQEQHNALSLAQSSSPAQKSLSLSTNNTELRISLQSLQVKSLSLPQEKNLVRKQNMNLKRFWLDLIKWVVVMYKIIFTHSARMSCQFLRIVFTYERSFIHPTSKINSHGEEVC